MKQAERPERRFFLIVTIQLYSMFSYDRVRKQSDMGKGIIMGKNKRKWNIFLLIGITTAILSFVMEEMAYAQLGKIHRKTALLSVEPEVITQGRAVSVTIQPFTEDISLLLSLYNTDGERLVRKIVPKGEAVSTRRIEIPGNQRGRCRVLLEAKEEGSWQPVAEQTIVLMPDYYDSVQREQKRIQDIENKSKEDGRMQRASWAALAYAEDLLERMKTAGSGQVWDLQRRLKALQTRAKELEEGTDILEGKTGYQLRGYRSSVNGEIQLYSLYVPKGYDAEKSWPLAVMLHGAWSNHHLALRRVMGHSNRRGESDDGAKRSMPELPDVPFIVIAPNGFETMSYEGFAEEDVWRVMDETALLFNVDPNRVYLTGLSMGGAGTGKLGIRNPGRFAAIAPVCGFFRANLRQRDEDMSEFQQRLSSMSSNFQMAENLLHVPSLIMHGDIDPVVPPQGSRDLYARLKELGYRTELEIYPGIDHAAWVPAYEKARIFDWFIQFERDPHPRKVVFKTGDPYGGSAYWITIQEPEKIRRFARVEAEINEQAIDVKSENVERLALRPDESLFSQGETIHITLDGQKVHAGEYQPEEWNFTRQGTGLWKKSDIAPAPGLLPGMSGGLEAMRERHVYVYGTAGSESEKMKASELALFKSLPGGNADVQWPVYPEERLTDKIIDSNNLVLFATVQGSAYLQKHMDSLPFKETGEGLEFAGRTVESDQALSFIYPNPANPRRYVLINTARTAEGLNALKEFASSQTFIGGGSRSDFVVYDGEGKPLWGGLFDKNWKVETVGDF